MMLDDGGLSDMKINTQNLDFQHHAKFIKSIMTLLLAPNKKCMTAKINEKGAIFERGNNVRI